MCESLGQRYYFDLTTGEIEVCTSEDEWLRYRNERDKKQHISRELGSRYFEIPCLDHSEVHELMDEFIESLDSEDAKKAAYEKYGIGETVRALEEHGVYQDSWWEFLARWWLLELGIEPIVAN